MSLTKNINESHNSVVKQSNNEQLLPFQTAEQEFDSLEHFRQEIFKSHAGLMEICRQANVPTKIRNLISGLIKLSGGEIVVKANDFEIASIFYQDETRRDALKKKVQRWRKALGKWQDETGLTLIQFRSGFQIKNSDGTEKNEKTEYRLVILDLAAMVISEGDLNLEWKAKIVLQDLLAMKLPSKLSETRIRPLEVGRCLNTSKSWVKKTLEIAKRDGELEEVMNEIVADIQKLFDEFLDEEGRTDASYFELNGETYLDTRSTIITSYSNNIDLVNDTNEDNKKDENNKEDEDFSYSDLNNKEANSGKFSPSSLSNLVSRINTKKDTSLSMLEQALEHARRGFRIFPVYKMSNEICTCQYGAECPTPAKHPHIKNWQNLATTNEDQIRQWWRKFRHANIGIATGDYSEEQILVVLDLDTKADGFETLEQLEQEFGKLPETLTAITGSKGRHFLFLAAKGLDIRNIQASLKLGKGLDIRGLNGFIVAVGSIHSSGNRYEWVDENTPIAEMPEWMIERLTAPVESKTYGGATVGSSHKASPNFSNFNQMTVIHEHEGRNNFLFVKALEFFRNGYERPTVEEQIGLLNKTKCEPPVGQVEINKLIDSAEERFPVER